MATEVIDLSPLSASLEAPSTPVEANVGIPEVPETKTADTKVEEAEPKVSEETPKQEKTAEEGKEEPKAKSAVRSELKTNAPSVLAKSVHTALTEFMKEHPTEQGRAKLVEINNAVAALYSQVADAKAEAKDIREVTSAASELESLVKESDNLVYSGDPQIVSNIYDDVVAQNGNSESFDKLVPAFVDKLKATNPEKYYSDHVAPIYEHALESTGMKDAVRGLISAYNSGDKSALRNGIEAIAKHIEEVGSKVAGHKAEAEKVSLAKEQSTYKTSLQNACDQEMNSVLTQVFKPVLNKTVLGDYPRDVQIIVAKEVRSEVRNRLAKDKVFNALINKPYAAKNTQEVLRIYKSKVASIAEDCMDAAINRIYPNGL